MKVAIVYISYRQDLVWLVYSLQLLTKFLKGDYELIVRVDENCRDVVTTWGVPARYVYLQNPWPDGYTFAMHEKMIADDYVSWDTDVIWLLDSDHMLLRPRTIEDFFEDGKPLLHYADWSAFDPEYARVAKSKWAEPTERAIGVPLDREFMIAPPFAFWTDTFRNCRQRITARNATSFFDFAYSGVPYHSSNFMTHPMRLCDYETLSLYAATFESDRYTLRPAPMRWPFKVYWSHGDWTPQLQAELDGLLAS